MKIRKDFVCSTFSAITGIYIFASFANGKIYSDCSDSLNSSNKIIESSLSIRSKKSLLEDIKTLETVVELTRNNPLYYPFGFAYDLIKN